MEETGWRGIGSSGIQCALVSASGNLTGDAAWLDIQERSGQRVNSPGSTPDGAVAFDERVWGCYLHALFENETPRRAWPRSPGWRSEGRVMNYDRRKAFVFFSYREVGGPRWSPVLRDHLAEDAWADKPLYQVS